MEMDAIQFIQELETFKADRLLPIVGAGRTSLTDGTPGDAQKMLQVALANEISVSEVAAAWMPTASEIDVKLALARQAGDEAGHFQVVADRLAALGFDVSGFAMPDNPVSILEGPIHDRGAGRCGAVHAGVDRLRRQRELHEVLRAARGCGDGAYLPRIHPARRTRAPAARAAPAGQVRNHARAPARGARDRRQGPRNRRRGTREGRRADGHRLFSRLLAEASEGIGGAKSPGAHVAWRRLGSEAATRCPRSSACWLARNSTIR